MPSESHQQANQPECKIGPFSGGFSVAVWLNTVETRQGPRKKRSITISPRRYKDSESGEWRDASSFREVDLPKLILALIKAFVFCATTPLPGQAEANESNDDDTMF